MRSLFLAAAVCAALLLPAAAAAAVPPAHVGDGQHETRGSDEISASAQALAPKTRFSPLGARLAGGATVYGHLVDSHAVPTASAWVEWDSWVEAEQKWYWDEQRTAADGYFSMTGVVPTTYGEIWAYPDDDGVFALGGESWSNGGSYGYTLYPGRVSVVGQRGGVWKDFEKLVVRISGSDRYSKGAVTAPDTTSSPVTGDIDVLSGNYYSGSAKFFWDEGIEFFGSVGVSPGTTAGTLTVDEADAQRVWLKSPYWYSGKPGATVKVALNNFPAGWINRVTGYTDDPKNTASKAFGTWTSAGTSTQSKSIKIPSTAKPGYGYWIGFQHVDSTAANASEYPLYLEEVYQVCTMKASRTSVRKGTKIRVKGIVPTAGNWGDGKGLRKVVTLYAHRGTAPVPTKWNPKSKGWVKVGSVRTNGYGAYTTPYFKALKTLTLVARYPGDDWYYDGYTSTQKITVR